MARDTSPKNCNETILTLLEIKLSLPGCSSLKEKRGHLKPLLSRLHKAFNVSASETCLQDVWQSAWVAIALVSNDVRYNSQKANEILNFIVTNFPDLEIDEHHIENR
jgi:hypothetical protein